MYCLITQSLKDYIILIFVFQQKPEENSVPPVTSIPESVIGLSYLLKIFCMIHTQIAMMIRAAKIPTSPFAIISSAIIKFSIITVFPPFSFYKYEATMLITRPPATTDAICPDTFAPAACMIMIFPGDSS